MPGLAPVLSTTLAFFGEADTFVRFNVASK
jgi:hypothetical protein